MGRLGLETIISELKPLDGAIVGEPNGMEICVAQKGALVLNLTWKGKGAHAAHGTPEHAIRKSIEDLSALSKMTWPWIDPFLGETKLEITQVHAGERVNVIPDRAHATVDIRYAPVYHPEEILGKIRMTVRGDVKVYSDRRRAMKTEPTASIVKAAQKAQPNKNLVGSKTSSDWVFLGETPAIKMGPGNTEISHTTDEYIEISQVTKGVEIYKQTILNFMNLFTR
jgi:acetylornithine deacetylase